MVYRFGECTLDTQRHRLQRSGQSVRLRAKAFQVLCYLLERRDRTVLKSELCAQVWPQSFISEATLESTLRTVRQAIGDTGHAQQLIQTVYGYGYRFIAAVEVLADGPPGAAGEAVRSPPGSASAPPPDDDLHAAPVPITPGSTGGGASRRATARGDEGGPTPQKDAAMLTPESPAAPSPVWEQKPVAVLAIELTFPTAVEGEAAAYAPWTAASRWQQTLVAKVQEFGGVVLQRSPSLLLVAFGVPQTLEQLPQRAVQAALVLRHLVAEGADREPCPELRQVVHWGPLLVDVHANDPTAQLRTLGGTLAWPVRLLGQAAAGDILLLPEVGLLVEGRCEVQAREVSLQGGQPGRIQVYAVVGNRPRGSRLEMQGLRPLSRFVGRDQELATLCTRLPEVEAGRGQVVGMIGEPGVGKSRLCYEFIRGSVAPPWVILEAQATAYGQATPYLPVLDLLKSYFRIEERDALPTVRDKVTAKLRGLDDTLKPAAPALLPLLDVPIEDREWQALDAPQRRQRTLDAIKRLLVWESQGHPLLLVVENLHWIDAETQAVLDRLVESLPTARVLLIVTYRPEYQHDWGNKTYYTQLRLDPLARESAGALLDNLMGDDAALVLLKQHLIVWTEGNPFFLEESIRLLVETQVLVGARGAYGLAQALPSIQVPATVQAVLAARIDRLPSEAKRLLQTAAVIGKDIPRPLLQAIAGIPEAELEQSLIHLQAAELLYETADVADRTLTFKHTLTREAAYRSLPVSTRQQYHQQVARPLEARFPERVEARPELLAHHYTEAGLGTHALPYWQRAGQRAIQRSANAEAVCHLTRGLEILKTLPGTLERAQHELRMQTALGSALMVTKGFGHPEVERTYARARALCQQVGDTPELFPVLSGLWRFANGRAQHQQAWELGEHLLAVAQQSGDPALLLQAHHALWTTASNTGAFPTAYRHVEHGLALYSPQQYHAQTVLYGGHDPGVCGRSYASQIVWLLGYPDQAEQWNEAALALAHELGHPFTLGHTLLNVAGFHKLRWDDQRVYEWAQATRALGRAQESPYLEAQGTVLLGWALAAQGQSPEGITQIHQGLAAWQAIGTPHLRAWLLALLAEAYGHMGRIEEGLAALAEALTIVDTTGGRKEEAELYRLKGELLWQAGCRPEEAEACFHHALTIARRQQAKSWELRAAVGLSRLWQRRGMREDACQLLAPLYGWFTEGFDTADLREAKALLEELS